MMMPPFTASSCPALGCSFCGAERFSRCDSLCGGCCCCCCSVRFITHSRVGGCAGEVGVGGGELGAPDVATRYGCRGERRYVPHHTSISTAHRTAESGQPRPDATRPRSAR